MTRLEERFQPRTPAGTDERCCVHLLGRFSVGAGGSLVELAGRKTEELLAYLLLHRHRPHHREVVAGTLWPESGTAQSKKYLRQALWNLRSLGTGGRFLQAQAEWILVDLSRVWLDVAELEEAYEQVRLVPGEQLDAVSATAIKGVVPHYRGDLLEGCYQDWCIYERERLKALYISLLEKLLAYCEACGEPDEGLVYGEQLLRHEPAHERAHWRLMRLHYLAGDRTGALRQFERCREALREELQTAPGERVLRLCEQIRADAVLPALRPGGSPTELPDDTNDGVLQPTESFLEALRALALATSLVEEGIRAVRLSTEPRA